MYLGGVQGALDSVATAAAARRLESTMAENAHRVFVETNEDAEVEGFHDVYVNKAGAWQQCNNPNCGHSKDHSAIVVSRPGSGGILGF